MQSPLTGSTFALALAAAASLPPAYGASRTTSIPFHFKREEGADINAALRRRLPSNVENGTDEATLEGTPTDHAHGMHHVEIFVGSPAQSQSLLLSTHEDRIYFPCKGCTSCGGRESRYYNQHLSNQFEFVSCGEGSSCQSGGTCWKDRVCQIESTFLDGQSSWSAFDARDLVYVGSGSSEESPIGTNIAETHGFPFSFGCQTSMRGEKLEDLADYADGLLGMSPKPSSFLHQLYRAGQIQHRAFSLCSGAFDPRASGKESAAGAITMERPLTASHETPMVFAKNIDPLNRYQPYLERVYILPHGEGGVGSLTQDTKVIPVEADYIAMNTGDRRVIIDSATKLTQLDVSLKGPFEAAWKEATGVEYSTENISIGEGDIDLMPTFIFQFTRWNAKLDLDPTSVPGYAGIIDRNHPNSVLVAMTARSYMTRSEQNGRFYSNLSLDHPIGSVLGANFLRGHDVFFDVEDGRIGFSEATYCGPKKKKEESAQVQPASVDDPSMHRASSAQEVDECNGDYYSCCVSATCRSFMAVAYAFVAIAILGICLAMRERRNDKHDKHDERPNSGFD